MLDNFAKTWCEPIGNTKYQVKYAFKILHIQKLFQPIVLGLDCDTFTARCWEECWKNLDFGHCFCYSFYSKYLCIFICFIVWFLKIFNFPIYFCGEQNHPKCELFCWLMVLIFDLSITIQQKIKLLSDYRMNIYFYFYAK